MSKLNLKPSKGRLTEAEYRTVRGVYFILDAERCSIGWFCKSLTRFLTGLGELCGHPVPEAISKHSHASPHITRKTLNLYLRIMQDIRARSNKDEASAEEIRVLRKMEAKYKHLCQRLQDAEQQKKHEERPEAKREAMSGTTSHRALEGWPAQGIRKGDYVIVTTDGIARTGQLVYFKQDGHSFVSILHEATATHYCIEGSDGKRETVSLDDLEIEGEVVAIVTGRGRDYLEKLLNGQIPVVNPAKQQRPARKKGDDETESRIAELKQKISKLDYEPENEACFFRLQSELWKLEHPAEDSILDAEYITGRGFTNREGGKS